MITERTKAILLFTSYLSKDTDRQHKPLSLIEWNKLVRWLQSKDAFPEAFLSEESEMLLNSWNDQLISRNRLYILLERKTALAIALDKWTKAGVWVISRADQVYPKMLKEKLKGAAPNILFGIGDKQLLNQSYVGVIGSRNASEKDLNAAKAIGQKVTKENLGIVSGGAKGIDEAAMIGALEAGGSCVGFLADSLIKKSTSPVFRNFIIKNKLALLTHVNPEAGFNAGNAMSRNKLIYALAETSIVVISDTKGGTWEGAKENVKNHWTPLWVCPSNEKGNQEIVKLGGKWLPDNLNDSFRSLISPAAIKVKDDLFTASQEPTAPNVPLINQNNQLSLKISAMSNFEFFIYKWHNCFGQAPVNKNEVAERFEMASKQVEIWLDLAVENGFANKLRSKIGYSWLLEKSIDVLSESSD
ncbi:DNA-processing protein DprA [Mucilaginibacter sp.]|uniref:DNA-processing protein DprA n=1 Tax=Mucilaginibacter sp. TaxID=1882438 RepID=UPI003D10995E